jgi:hypothetical protein
MENRKGSAEEKEAWHMTVHLRVLARNATAVLCSFLIGSGTAATSAPWPYPQGTQEPSTASAKIPNDQLDSLIAPIALYPDPLLAQVLAASTYPLEIVQLQQWLSKNTNLKDKALMDAAEKQPWDPSVQALAVLPDVVKRLVDDIQWTTDLGNAFLAQESDVMDAVQRMRLKAKNTGNLKSSEQQVVETKSVENKSVIVIQPSSPEVVYVPSYNPTVVYGPPAYPYPPIYYPPPGYYAAGMAISFGVGLAVGAAWGGGGWGWGCGWGGNNNITINNNNNFVRNSNRQNNINNISGNRGGGNSWQHNPQHRGGAPYGDRSTAGRFGGTTRGDSLGNRQASARQNLGQAGSRQQIGAGNRGNGVAGDGNRSNGVAGNGNRSNGVAGNRPAGGARDAGNLGASRPSGGDRVGDRSVSRDSAGSRGSAFGGASGGGGGAGARASSSRGASSMGGGSRGSGGGRGGGRRR